MVIRTKVCKIPNPTPFNILCCLVQIRETCFFYQKLPFSLHNLKMLQNQSWSIFFCFKYDILPTKQKHSEIYKLDSKTDPCWDKQFQTLDVFVLPKWDQIKHRLLENCSFHGILLLFHVSIFRSTISLLITIHFAAKQMDWAFFLFPCGSH